MSRANIQRIYQPLADGWTLYDNSGEIPKWIEEGP